MFSIRFGDGQLRHGIKGFAESVETLGWKPTTFFLAAIVLFGSCLIMALACVLGAIVLPTITLIVFIRGLVWKLVRKDLNC